MAYSINEDRIKETFKTLVKINSPSSQEREVADFVAARIGELGFEVNEDDAGRHLRANQNKMQEAIHTGRPTGNLICRKKGNQQGPTLLFSAHMDTVLPNPNVQLVEENGEFRTDGKTILGADDKAGITALLEAAQVLQESKMSHPDLEFIFTISEETGLDGARLLDTSTLKAEVGFVMDSGDSPDVIIHAAPYETDFDIEIKGKAAHSGVNPEDGINAIEVAAEAISNLQMGRIDEETTLNIGIISGGKQTNIVCDLVRIVGEARSISKDKLTDQLAKVETAFQTAADKWKATYDIQQLPMYDGFRVTDDDLVVQLAKSGCEKAGMKARLAPRGGGSDTNIYNSKGIPAVNLGVGAQLDHTVQEHVRIEHLKQASMLVLGIIEASLELSQKKDRENQQNSQGALDGVYARHSETWPYDLVKYNP